MENIEIIAAESGTRIDAWLSEQMPELTRSAAQRLLGDGMVLVNGKPPKKNYKISAGDTVVVTIPEIAEVPLVPQNIPLDIVLVLDQSSSIYTGGVLDDLKTSVSTFLFICFVY